MNKFFILLFLISPAYAVDKALVLNDQEQAALREILDSATKAEGLKIAPNTVYLLNKLNTAPIVTEQKLTDKKEGKGQ